MLAVILAIVITILVIYSILITVLFVSAVIEHSSDPPFVEYRKRRSEKTRRKLNPLSD